MTNKKTFEVLDGNYYEFGHSSKTVQENHKENCIYRLAMELKEELL